MSTVQYTKTNWQNDITALNQGHMNNIESGIEAVVNAVNSNQFTTELKNKLDNIEAGAQVNTVTGVKGESVSSYSTGNVNIRRTDLGLGNVLNLSPTQMGAIDSQGVRQNSVTHALYAGQADSALTATTATSATSAGTLSSTLPITKGGTGATSLDAALTNLKLLPFKDKQISDSTSASALSNSSSNIVTERDIYFGLPTINGVHNYTSSTTLFAPTSAGTANQVLLSNGSGAPTWAAQSSLSVGNATKATGDKNGNDITTTYLTKTSGISGITFNSTGTVTITKGDGTSTSQAVYAQIPTLVYVGSTQPTQASIVIWIDTTSNANTLKVRNSSNAWVTPTAVWG